MSVFRTIADTLVSWGPIGVFLLAILDSAGVPIPEGVDVLIVLVAMQDAATGYLSATLATGGSLAGSLFLFHIGRKGGEAYLDQQISKSRWGRRFRAWFQHYGLLTVFIPALIPAPLPLKIFVLSAGAFEIRWRDFALTILAARIPRYFGEAYVGARVGAKPVELFKENALELTAVAILLFLVLLLLVKLMDRHRRRRTASR